MLRKAISFSIILMLIFLCYQVAVNFVKNGHNISYTIEKEHLYNIDEEYSKNDKGEYYLLKVTRDDDKVFVFDEDNVFNKQKEIVEDIIEFDNDEVTCVALKYIDDKNYSEPLCIKDNQLYSYQAIKKDVDLSSFVKSIKNFDLNKYDKKSTTSTASDITYNKDYLLDNEVLVMYDYKVMDYIDSRLTRNMTFSSIDNYKNTLGTVVGSYYLIPRLSTSATFDTYIKFGLVDGVKNEIKLDYKISKQAYINGVYENKLYIFDKSEMKQYEIDPYDDKVTIVGDEKNEGFAFINGKETKISVYDLSKEEVKFSENKDPYKSLDYDNIFIEPYKSVYVKNGKYYKVFEKYPQYSILLFTDNNAKEVKVREDNVYFIKDDSIYRYNKYGTVQLAMRNELKYNTDNVFDIYLK